MSPELGTNMRRKGESKLIELSTSVCNNRITSMRRFRYYLLIAAAGLAIFLWSQEAAHQNGNVFQLSTYSALRDGDFRGRMSLGQLGKMGNFGMGTLDGLDGELILVNGRFFHARGDGQVLKPSPEAMAAFGDLTFFHPSIRFRIEPANNLKEFLASIDRRLSDPSKMKVVRVNALFRHVKARSISKRNPPYPSLEEAIKHQSIFGASPIRGTLVGFYFPAEYGDRVIAGWHFHFVSANGKFGGHVLDLRLDAADVEAAYPKEFLCVV